MNSQRHHRNGIVWAQTGHSTGTCTVSLQWLNFEHTKNSNRSKKTKNQQRRNSNSNLLINSKNHTKSFALVSGRIVSPGSVLPSPFFVCDRARAPDGSGLLVDPVRQPCMFQSAASASVSGFLGSVGHLLPPSEVCHWWTGKKLMAAVRSRSSTAGVVDGWGLGAADLASCLAWWLALTGWPASFGPFAFWPTVFLYFRHSYVKM